MESDFLLRERCGIEYLRARTPPELQNERGVLVNGRFRIIVQVTIYRRPRIGRDGHLDQSEAYDIS